MLQFCVIMQKQYMSKIIGSSGRYCVLFILFQLYITKAGLFEDNFFLKFGFTPCKAEQPLQGMELQEKETQKD